MSEQTVFSPATPPSIGIGTRLSDIYQIDSLIGTGGMGAVYRGHNIETGDGVAIKTILPELAQNEAALTLFRKEASALHNLYHEAIVRYYVFTIDRPTGQPYLAMEYVAGESLCDVLGRGSVPYDDLRVLQRRLASGLAAAHAHGIIHRDVSPDNVILPDGDLARAKIIDFGIARSPLGEKTVIGTGFAGKYGYVSPEQLGLYGGEVTAASDIYSLGLVLAEAALGRRLDMSGTHADVIEKRRTVPDISAGDPRIRPLLEAMLQPNPADRPASMGDVAAWTPSEPSRAPAASAAPRRGAMIGIAAAVLLAVAGTGAFVLLPSTDVPRAPALPANVAPATAMLEERTPPAPVPTPLPTPSPAAPALPMPSPAPSPPAAVSSPLAPSTPPALERPAPPLQTVSPTNPVLAPVEPAGRPVAPSPAREQASPARPPSAPETSVAEAPPPQQLASRLPLPAATTPARNSPPEAPRPAIAPSPSLPPIASLPAPIQPLPPQPAPAPSTTERMAAFLREFQGGNCFAARPLSLEPRDASVEGFGARTAPFEKLDADFLRTFDVEPKIQLRLIADAQCPVIDLIARRSDASGPRLELRSDVVRSGQELAGTAETRDGHLDLLLVADDGAVHPLSTFLQRRAGSASFALRLEAAGTSRSEPKPQLVVAVASSKPLRSLSPSGSVPIGRLVRQVEEEAAQTGASLGFTVRYFKLGP